MRALVAFTVLTAVAAAQRLPENAEPNGSLATATPLPVGHEAFGTLATPADGDWYRVTLAATADLRAETAPGHGAAVVDTVVTLFDASGSPLRANDDGVGCGAWSRLQANGLAAGTYYLAVEAGAGAVAGGSYTLDVRAATTAVLVPGATVAEGAENNDVRTGGVATTVALPVRCDGTLANAADWDFYRFTLATESLVRAGVGATPTHPLAPRADDPVLYLFDTASPPNRLAGPFHGRDYAVWDAAFDLRLAPGSYHVAIRGWAGSVLGRYYLDLVRGDAATVTVHAGGCGGRALAVAADAALPIERSVLGTTYTLRGSNLGAGGFTFHVVGLQATAIDLTPAGAPGCTLEVVAVDTPLQLADAAGAATFFLAIPEAVALAGLSLESQLAVFDLSNPLGITLSNRVSARVGP